jgi:hypothetical protein
MRRWYRERSRKVEMVLEEEKRQGVRRGGRRG